jgi:hypothetical protein
MRLRLNKDASLIVPRALLAGEIDAYQMEWYGHDGIDMREDPQVELVRSWAAFGALFDDLRADPQINARALGSVDELRNEYFMTPDAEVYGAVLATFRPRQVIEVGGGYSTLVARRTIEHLGLDTRLLVVDPEPRTDIREAADELVRAYVEDIDVDSFPLDDPLLLFIDSSHITRAGGDVQYLYNRLVPRLPAGSVVHAHDVFIPFEYPPRYQARFYSEQVVLHALLQSSARFEVLFAGKFLAARHPKELRRVFGPTVPVPNEGASFWFRVRD